MRLLPAGLLLFIVTSLLPAWGQVADPLTAAPPTGSERIISYHTAIAIQYDGGVDVQEDVRVLNTGQNMPNGFELFFANSRYDSNGLRRILTPTITQVLRDGKPEPFLVEKGPKEARLIISGSGGRYPVGLYNYTIRYSSDAQLLQLPDRDELQWEVRGDIGDLAADSVSVTVTLPDGMSTTQATPFARVTALTGDTNEFTITPTGANSFTCTASRPLRANENLTFGISMPPHLILRPTSGQVQQQILRDNPEIYWAIAGILIVLLYFLLVWAAVGRDPRAGKATPRFTPPAALSPAAVRYLRHLHHDDIGLATVLVNAATHGLVKISEYTDSFRIMRIGDTNPPVQRLVLTELKRGYILTYPELAARVQLTEEVVKNAVQQLIDEESVPIVVKKGKLRLEKSPDMELPPSDTPLTAEEYAVLNCLLPGITQSIMVDKGAQEEFYQARKVLCASLEAGYAKRYFSTNSNYFGFGLIIAIIGLLPAGMWVIMTEDDSWTPWLAMGGMTIAALVFFVSLLPAWKRVLAGGRLLRKTLWWLIPVSLFFAGLGFVCSDLLPPPPIYLSIYAVLMLALNILFQNLLTAMTMAGRAVLDSIEGFRHYLTGEVLLPEAPVTNAQFEACLPYALAMDLPDNWTANFVRPAHGDCDPKPYTPAWYSGEAWKSGQLGHFVHALIADFAMSINAIPDAAATATLDNSSE